MSDYTIRAVTDVPDIFEGQYPGAMRFLTDHLKAQQTAFTHRLMPPRSGGKGSYGHRHKTQEEIYILVNGSARMKIDDELVEMQPFTAVRVAKEAMRGYEAGPEGAELIVIGAPRTGSGDADLEHNWWSD